MSEQSQHERRVGTAFFDVVILGAGVAGLAAAIRIKDTLPTLHVGVIEKSSPESNSQIAGQRYRTRANFHHEDETEVLLNIMSERNNGIVTPQMRMFAEMSPQVLQTWIEHYRLNSHDKPEWFGPQLGGGARSVGHGKRVLTSLRGLADSLSVNFIEGEVLSLEKQDSTLAAVDILAKQQSQRYSARAFVLANGSSGGSLFHSTNKRIRGSAHELALASGLPLVGATINMLHPFGRCSPDGSPRVGCYETDMLADADIYLGTGHTTFDYETSNLLRRHEAHQHMGAIARRFYELGSIASIHHSDGRHTNARVSHHHSHLGIQTSNGVSISGITNGFAVGDASDIGYWTGYQERLPGAALTKCLIDAELVSQQIEQMMQQPSPSLEASAIKLVNTFLPLDSEVLRINTHFLVSWKMAETAEQKRDLAEQWREALDSATTLDTPLVSLSKKVASAHERSAKGYEEPILINNL